jgi:acetyl esterase/lipase
MKIRAVVVLLFLSLFMTVVGQAAASTPVTLSLTSSEPASIFAHDVTFTVTTDPPVTATVSINNGRRAVATVAVVNGTGTWTSDTLPAGALSIWAACATDCEGTSEAVLQTIERAGVALRASIETPFTDAGQVIRINVAAALIRGEYVPHGNIDISENDVVLASGPMTGSATFDIADLSTGEHVLMVRYYDNKNCYDTAETLRHTVLESHVGVEPIAVTEGNESSNLVTVNVRLSGKSSHEVDVDWKTVDGSGVAGRDYDAASGTLTFAPGETTKAISINVIGNQKPEQEKTFTIVATGPENVSEGVVRIVNDDPFFERKPGLAYGPAADNTLDLYVPLTGSGPYPVIIGIEATDFVAVDRDAKVTIREAERGYIVAKVSFRPDEMAPFPAQIQDLKAAVRWLRAHATEYQIDPNRVGVWGIGPGGHLAVLLGTTDASAPFDVSTEANAEFSGRVQAVVDWYGEVDFAQIETDESYTRYLGCAALDCPDVAAAANATNYVTADDPPLLIVQGANDQRVPVPTVQDLYMGLRYAGVDSRLTIVDGVGHGGPGWNNPALLEQVDRFFDEKLKP